MDAVSGSSEARARKNEKIVLQRLASVGQATVATALKVDESTISRLKNGAISQLASTLAVLGLKVVPIEFKCYRPEDIDPYIQLAKRHMRTVVSAHDLVDDDPE
jgi:Ran GTPase-activating protein (RanGAP) involved in mRNA processing and transport